MNRTDRLLAIVLELQGKKRQRAQDLAATFEVSVRTIYRDVEALGEAGVPLVSTPGRGYTLMDGYFLPPLSFSADEAMLLLLGSDVMARSFDTHYRAAAQSASRKIIGMLPDQQRQDVAALRERIRFIAGGITGDASPHAAEQALLHLLRQAVVDCATVRFLYHTRHTADETPAHRSREADPYGLFFLSGAWYLSAYCHLRHDVRNFRLERMDDLALTGQMFTRPTDLQLRRRDLMESESITLRLLFAPEVVRWVRESPSFYAIAEEETPDGLLMTLRVRHVSEILPWILRWGGQARVLEPASLRQRVAEEAAAMLRLHDDAACLRP
ncbi:MAG: YafY family protein [Ktedonobacterales bacterium]